MPLAHPDNPPPVGTADLTVTPLFTREPLAVPCDRLPEAGMDAELAYQLVHDELMLDGNARLNLASFVTTWMEPQASRLMSECADKNMIDKDEYPRTAELERRCVRMLAQLWSAPDPDAAPGCSTTGSSEAIGVVAVLGSTFDGSYEPVAQICAALDELAAAGGPDVPVHVDGDPER